MELLCSYSKLLKLSIPTQLVPVSRPRSRPARLVRRRLTDQQITDLCAQYRLGATTRTLSERYGIGKTAVTELLRDHDVSLRHKGLSLAQVNQATQLYAAGKSVAQVATELGLHPSSVYDALARSEVVMRKKRST